RGLRQGAPQRPLPPYPAAGMPLLGGLCGRLLNAARDPPGIRTAGRGPVCHLSTPTTGGSRKGRLVLRSLSPPALPCLRNWSPVLQQVATFCLVARCCDGSPFSATESHLVTCVEIDTRSIRYSGNAPEKNSRKALPLGGLQSGRALPGGGRRPT